MIYSASTWHKKSSCVICDLWRHRSFADLFNILVWFMKELEQFFISFIIITIIFVTGSQRFIDSIVILVFGVSLKYAIFSQFTSWNVEQSFNKQFSKLFVICGFRLNFVNQSQAGNSNYSATT